MIELDSFLSLPLWGGWHVVRKANNVSAGGSARRLRDAETNDIPANQRTIA
jgi:hypothetical protein